MTELRVRDVEDAVIGEYKARAKRHGHSLSDEVRAVLNEGIRRPRLEMAERLSALRESIRSEFGEMPDSTAYIRQMRDSRG